MKNPYKILGINQDADKAEILKAQMQAMKKKEYTLHEIAEATKQLLDPTKRLVADFLFPSKIKVKRLNPIVFRFDLKYDHLNNLDENLFDSLKNY